MITVTLNQIKDSSLFYDGWKKVLKANGGLNADFDKPFPLVSILDSNGLDDTLWVIARVPELSKYEKIWREFSRWCALQNIELIKPYCSSEDYDLIVKWLTTGDESIMDSAWSVAESAAWSVVRSASWSASWSAERSAQETKLRELLV